MADALSEIIQNILVDSLDRPLAGLRTELAARLASECETAQAVAAARAADEAARAAHNSAVESLNVAVRRIRRAESITEIGSTLLETASAYGGRAAFLVHKNATLSGWRAYGFESADTWSGLRISLEDAPALAQAVESREALVSLSLPDALSPALVDLLGLAPEEKVYLFPLCLRSNVVGLVYADGVGGAGVQPAALELLCSVAEASIEALFSRPPVRGENEASRLELDREIAAATQPSARMTPPDWNEMSPPEREMHLRAQRFARVLAADLQLYRSQEIREGKQDRDIYGHLRDEIDKSREVYFRKFGHSATAGIDYFHLELVRSLADDQEEILGPGYPGPLVASVVG